jgi:hypothetical protein
VQVRRRKEYKGPLRFWAEWEAQSQVISTIAEPLPSGPKFIYKPYYVAPSFYHDLQNTDPFVFGGFFYTGCQQWTKKGPTQLRYLQRGSVVLFGSCVDGGFALDTVFVVNKWVDHSASDFRSLLWNCVPEGYREVTLAAWYKSNRSKNRCAVSTPRRSFRLYWGATITDPVDDMYSYFPCQPADQSPCGFPRPLVAIPDRITNDLLQGKRLNRGVSQADVTRLWHSVRKQVESALWLGVWSKMPKRREAL